MTPLLSIRDAARLLGVSVWTVRRLIQSGTLIPVHIGSRILLEEASLAQYIAAHRG